MALPDRFEQVGVLVGSVFLVGLTLSALVGTLFGQSLHPWLAVVVWVLPGLLVGVPLAMGRLPVSYHQVWVITLSSWLLAYVGWGLTGLASPTGEPVLAVGIWLLAVLLGSLLAWVRPVATVRTRLGLA